MRLLTDLKCPGMTVVLVTHEMTSPPGAAQDRVS